MFCDVSFFYFLSFWLQLLESYAISNSVKLKLILMCWFNYERLQTRRPCQSFQNGIFWSFAASHKEIASRILFMFTKVAAILSCRLIFLPQKIGYR